MGLFLYIENTNPRQCCLTCQQPTKEIPEPFSYNRTIHVLCLRLLIQWLEDFFARVNSVYLHNWKMDEKSICFAIIKENDLSHMAEEDCKV